MLEVSIARQMRALKLLLGSGHYAVITTLGVGTLLLVLSSTALYAAPSPYKNAQICKHKPYPLSYFLKNEDQAASREPKYNLEGIKYNGAVCFFMPRYIFHLDQYISADEWSDLKKGKHDKAELFGDSQDSTINIYTYAHDGIAVDYIHCDIPSIWTVKFAAHRLPAEMRHKKYFLKHFNIQPADHLGNKLIMECDAGTLTVIFDGEATVSMKVELSHT